MTKDFKKLSSKVDYENPFFKVVNYKVRRPNGTIKPYWVLSKRGNFSVIIPLFPNSETILVGQYRIPVDSYSWEFPMGQVLGKNPLETAKQELFEETGIKAKIWRKLGQTFLAPGHHEQRMDTYLAQNIVQGKSQPEENEFLELKRVRLGKVREMIEKREIKDGPTITAYYLLEQYLNSL